MDHPIDGEIAGLIATPTYSFEENHFSEFRALEKLVGHPNVSWNNGEAAVNVFSGELTLTLETVQVEPDASESGPSESGPSEAGPSELVPAKLGRANRA